MAEILDINEVRIMAKDKALKKVFATLTPREERLIRMRFGYGSPQVYTLTDVCNLFKVKPERVAQIENKALYKLFYPENRQELQKGGYISFIDFIKELMPPQKQRHKSEN